MAHVTGHTHDGEPGIVFVHAGEAYARADGIAAGEVPRGHRLVDDRHVFSPGDIPCAERPTANDRDAHRLEIVTGHDSIGSGLRRPVAADLAPFLTLVEERSVGVLPAEGRRVDQAGALHARHCRNSLEQRAIELRGPGRIGVGITRHRRLHRHHPGRLEAGIHRQQRDEAAHQQPGAADQHHGQRRFDRNQRQSRTRAAAGGHTAAGFDHRVAQICRCKPLRLAADVRRGLSRQSMLGPRPWGPRRGGPVRAGFGHILQPRSASTAWNWSRA